MNDPASRMELAFQDARRRSTSIARPSVGTADFGLEHARAQGWRLFESDVSRAGAWGWKLGATSPEAQRRFGTDAPFLAPIAQASVTVGHATLSLDAFVRPLLEAELVAQPVGDSWQIVTGIEVADTRFASWDMTIVDAIADFGLHGHLVLGSQVAGGTDEIGWKIWRDEALVADGTVSPQTAIDRWRWASGEARSLPTGGLDGRPVATGSLGQPMPLVPGEWLVEIGAGTARLTVT